MTDYLDRVTCGDCLDVLRELPDCSVDLCATDPPYGIAFMSREWDQELPGRAIWAEVLRVLKPGASCFVCAGSRQDTILGLLTDLREVGFDIQHAALSWVYWSGFPKSTDVGKDLDKAAFLAWLREVPPGETDTRQALMGWDASDVRKAASAAVNGEAPVFSHATATSGDYGEGYSGKRPSGGIGVSSPRSHGTLLLSSLQARFGDAPGVRAKVGVAGHTGGGRTCMNCTPETGRVKDCLEGEYNFPSPATPEAVEWDGWHSGSVPLKPASEQILWVTKPAEPGPARANVLKWGVGAVNVGECRVPFDSAGAWEKPEKPRSNIGYKLCEDNTERMGPDASGRYPSNLLVSSRALGDDSKYGDLEAWAAARGLSPEWLDVALSAGVLRVAKPARSEKNAGLDERCSHPTCKPLTLMAFLCTLACPREGVVLDPFLGSGTAAVAAVSCGMHFIGIEREAEYIPIAEARVAHAIEQMRPPVQPTLALEAAE